MCDYDFLVRFHRCHFLMTPAGEVQSSVVPLFPTTVELVVRVVAEDGLFQPVVRLMK